MTAAVNLIPWRRDPLRLVYLSALNCGDFQMPFEVDAFDFYVLDPPALNAKIKLLAARRELVLAAMRYGADLIPS